jgi:hypothetical protein
VTQLELPDLQAGPKGTAAATPAAPADRTAADVEVPADAPTTAGDPPAGPTQLWLPTDLDGPPALSPPVTRRRSLSRRELVTFVSAAGPIAIIIVMLLMSRGAPSTPQAAGPAAVPATARPTAVASRHVPVHAWSSEHQRQWTGGRRHSVAFEVAADEPVAIWLGRARPILVVRCVDKAMQTFVFTGSALKIEPNTEDHTVSFGFDNDPLRNERWTDSEEHDALFAPDGALFARRIVDAHALSFGYTPHNAAPVVARFQVSGLGDRIEPVAAACGWKK